MGTQCWMFAALLTGLFFEGASAQKHFQDCAFNTGESAILVIEASIEPTFFDQPLQPGDEVAVFTPEGICAGAVIWIDGSTNVALTMWGDDPITPETDGYLEGEDLALRVWSNDYQIEAGPPPASVEVAFDDCGERPPLCVATGTYQRESLSFLDQLSVPPLPTAGEARPELESVDILLFPNPVRARAQIVIRSQAAGPTHLSVIDAVGRTVLTGPATFLDSANVHNLELDTSSLFAGTYFLLARSASATTLKPFVIIR